MRERAAVAGGASECGDASGTRCLAAHLSLAFYVLAWVLSVPFPLAASVPDTGEKVRIRFVASAAPPRPQVDWLELRRRSIPEPAALTDAIVWYRQQAAGRSYEKYSVAGLGLILIEASVIIALLLQRVRQHKSSPSTIESEKSFQLMADAAPVQIWMCDREGKITYLNQRRMAFTGPNPAAGLADVWTAFIHPDDRENVLSANAIALARQQEFSKEYRLRRQDGVYRWMLDVAAPRMDRDGSFIGFIGSAIDITDQKVARRALEEAGGKMIEAQEKERSRIARELHDDICQRLALLSMELEQVNRRPNGSTGPPNPKIEQIRRHCAEIACDVQALSHKLHSSKLEYLGLAAAIRSFCREFCQQNEVSVEFNEENVPGSLHGSVSLTLFRVTQEALQNALIHSGARQFSVSLRGTPDEIQLEVSDLGSGFNVEEARRAKGLGLISMQERVNLVHGSISIKSALNSGTRILVRVPLAAELRALPNGAECA